MLGAGLKPLQDCPNYAATGGMTRKLLPTLGASAPPLVEANRRSLDPKAIRDDFLELLVEHDIQVLDEHRIASCEMDSGAIRTASFDLAPFDELGCPVAEPKEHDHLRVTAKVFIDASYEGDLMDRAGVPFRVGREAESEYDEELAGVREPMEITSLDPFVEPGNPDSDRDKLAFAPALPGNAVVRESSHPWYTSARGWRSVVPRGTLRWNRLAP